MKFESHTGVDAEGLNPIQEALQLKPTYKHLFREARLFTQKIAIVRRDEKAREASIIESLYPQRPFEGLRVDNLALVRYIAEGTKDTRRGDRLNWPYIGYNRWKDKREDKRKGERNSGRKREFRLFIEGDLPDEQTLPINTLVVFRSHFTYILEGADREQFHDNDLDLSPFSDFLHLETAPLVENTFRSLEEFTQRELLAADIGGVSLKAVFGSREDLEQ